MIREVTLPTKKLDPAVKNVLAGLQAGQRIRFTSASDPGHSRHVRRLDYTVREGDTVAQIAQLFQCSAPEIRAWNGLGAHSPIHAGQKLHIHLVRRG